MILLGDYTAEFKRGKDKKPRKRRSGAVRGAIATTLGGAAVGIATTPNTYRLMRRDVAKSTKGTLIKDAKTGKRVSVARGTSSRREAVKSFDGQVRSLRKLSRKMGRPMNRNVAAEMLSSNPSQYRGRALKSMNARAAIGAAAGAGAYVAGRQAYKRWKKQKRSKA